MKFEVGDIYQDRDQFLTGYNKIISIDMKYDVFTFRIYLENGFEGEIWIAPRTWVEDYINRGEMFKVDHFPWDIPEQMLDSSIKEIESGPKEKHKCNCSNYDIFNHGCRCGGI